MGFQYIYLHRNHFRITQTKNHSFIVHFLFYQVGIRCYIKKKTFIFTHLMVGKMNHKTNVFRSKKSKGSVDEDTRNRSWFFFPQKSQIFASSKKISSVNSMHPAILYMCVCTQTQIYINKYGKVCLGCLLIEFIKEAPQNLMMQYQNWWSKTFIMIFMS